MVPIGKCWTLDYKSVCTSDQTGSEDLLLVVMSYSVLKPIGHIWHGLERRCLRNLYSSMFLHFIRLSSLHYAVTEMGSDGFM